MSDQSDPKDVLKRYLQAAREALLWKLEGLSERDVRMPRTPTGTNLIGLVKHAANVEIGYFGDSCGRQWPTPDRVAMQAYDVDPQADMYAAEDETAAGIVDLYRRVWAFADETIDSRPLETVARVPWWPEDRAKTTLQRLLVHVIEDVSRHAGHADILREQIDGEAGLNVTNSNLPSVDWPSYVAKLTALAEAC
ncbi:MAG TPA: DinB family protein [Jatrophihabitans sp.]|jgi:uncharacterized damage-inducible protein DinB